MQPLNGTQTHPLSETAKAALRGMTLAPVPRNTLNPGVANRLLRGGLVGSAMLTSPYKNHMGKDIEHFRITAAGKEVIESK